MNLRRQTVAGTGLIPLGGLVLLTLLVIAGMLTIGSQRVLSEESRSMKTAGGWAALPGMGATILPRWTLGNFDPRLEGTARGEEWPLPAGISYSPHRSTTLTSFPRLAPGDPVPMLVLRKSVEGK